MYLTSRTGPFETPHKIMMIFIMMTITAGFDKGGGTRASAIIFTSGFTSGYIFVFALYSEMAKDQP